MSLSEKGPAKAPCKSCPYRRDVPSGVWHESEYDKLPNYDGDISEQAQAGAIGAFYCHSRDGRLCAGWVGCHDMDNSLGLRLASSFGQLSPEDVEAALTYESPVELFESGAAAAKHGKRSIESPDARTRRTIDRLSRKLPPRS